MMMNNRTNNVDKPTVGDDSLQSEEVIKNHLPESADSAERAETKEPKQQTGVILKNARESQGLSLEIVHEATKIPLDALRAIEEGYTIRMLSPFYYRGFVRMYAQYLNIDAAHVIEDYKEEELPEHIDQKIDDFEVPKWISNFFTRQRKQQMVIGVGIILALFLLVKFIGFLGSRESKSAVKQEAVQKAAVKIKAVKKEIKKVVQEPRKVIRKKTPKIIAPKEAPKVIAPMIPKSVKPAVSRPPAVVQKNVNLTVRANQNSWLRVKTDGIVVFQSTLRMGAVETWFADKEIEISGRNINRLEFELNGKMIGMLGRKDRNAKKVVITKSGLSVKQ